MASKIIFSKAIKKAVVQERRLFVCMDVIYQLIFGYDIFGYAALDRRLSGPFGDELIAGSFVQRFSLISLLELKFFTNVRQNSCYPQAGCTTITTRSVNYLDLHHLLPLVKHKNSWNSRFIIGFYFPQLYLSPPQTAIISLSY